MAPDLSWIYLFGSNEIVSIKNRKSVITFKITSRMWCWCFLKFSAIHISVIKTIHCGFFSPQTKNFSNLNCLSHQFECGYNYLFHVWRWSQFQERWEVLLCHAIRPRMELCDVFCCSSLSGITGDLACLPYDL